jgi:hypothetical protein
MRIGKRPERGTEAAGAYRAHEPSRRFPPVGIRQSAVVADVSIV